MDAARKYAYRMLLCDGMLDIRATAMVRRWGWLTILKRKGKISRPRSVADWLHNLALFSALDFEEFDEERLWRDFAIFEKQQTERNFYRQHFQRNLEKYRAGG